LEEGVKMFDSRYSRQSFLGENSEGIIKKSIIGIVGLGGGGSHIVQQLAHIGFCNFVIYDCDNIETSNLNRLIGSKYDDILNSTPKINIAIRMIKGLQPDAKIIPYKSRWQDEPYSLRNCDIIFGCIDGFAERRELETCARRYLIPYIDIGIDVNVIKGESPVMSGQVILSMPGGPCLTCLGYLNEKNTAKEAALYGDAGTHPQVVWANGVVASTAVGIAVDLLTGWTKTTKNYVYLVYYSNEGIMKPHPRTDFLPKGECIHYPLCNVGDPIFKKI
jgi:molybdopterin-synthase adenylyltransferase